jgi:hypothetical protein
MSELTVARHDLGVLGELGEQQLDRDAIVEAHVAREHDVAHAALPEDALDLVLACEQLASGRSAASSTSCSPGACRSSARICRRPAFRS